MGRVRKLFDLVNGKLPSYNSAFLKLRGIAHPLDVFLSGRLRFARKVGSPLPIWLPDNQTTLASAVSPTKDQISVSELISWIQPGSKLLIDGRAFAYVDDVLNSGMTFLLTEPLITGYPAGTTVDLYGHPLELNGTYVPPVVTTHVPDDFVRGLQPRGSAVAAADTNQVLVGELTIDGVVTVTGDRVLLTNQTDPTENGVWVVSVFSWQRPSDFEGGTEASHAQVFVTGGATYAGTSWVCTATSGSDEISDPFALPSPIVGDPLTWAQLSTVTTFVVHSEYPIYPGDVINYKFFEYDVAEALSVGSLPDGRTTYQITVDVGIPDTLEDGSTTQVYLRAYPAYESERRPLPNIPITENNIGPFLYDRVSGSFFEDLEVEEVDVVSLFTASGTRILRQKDAGKNYLIYNVAIPSDAFLFWDLDAGRLNYSRMNKTFVAFTDDQGKFHLHFNCIPEIVHVQDFQGWRVQVTPQNDTYMVVQLEPNSVLAPFTTRAPGAAPPPPLPRGGVFLPAGVTTSVNIDFPEGSQDISKIHVMFDSEVVPGTTNAGTRIDMESWEIRGIQTTAFVSHATIAKVTGRNVWGSSSAFAKPYWLRLTYLQVQTDLYSRFNGGLLAL
jgi:hypothetical protein